MQKNTGKSWRKSCCSAHNSRMKYLFSSKTITPQSTRTNIPNEKAPTECLYTCSGPASCSVYYCFFYCSICSICHSVSSLCFNLWYTPAHTDTHWRNSYRTDRTPYHLDSAYYHIHILSSLPAMWLHGW